MSAGSEQPPTKLDEIRLDRALAAEEAARAFARERERLELEHAHARQTAEDEALLALEKAQWDSEAELAKLFHQTVAEVAKGSIDRSRDSAKYVQTAAAAIAALYSGLLALVFSVTDNPLPLRGVFADLFLGLAIALATAYLAFITRPRAPAMYRGGASLAEMALHRTGYLTKWVNATVHHRRWSLRAAVLSLGFGVAFIPAPFIAATRPATIPDPPVAPSIPSEVAPALADDAAGLFRAQTAGYAAAVEARNQAITDAATAAQDAAAEERRVDRLATAAALVGLLVVLLGPVAFERMRPEPA